MRSFFSTMGVLVGLLLLLAACAPRPPAEPPAAPATAPPVAAPTVPDDGPVSSRADRFCDDLLRIVEAEAGGFAALRTARVGPAAWQGALLPEGTRSCTVEGDDHPGAEYVCRGETIQGGRAELLEPAFRRLASDLDACLARAVWFPRNWERGRVMQFAGGERQQTWRDLAPLPKPAVALKIEEDFRNRLHYLRLAVFTLR